MLIAVMVKVALPGFDSCTASAAVVEPTFVLANDRLVGLSTACGVAGATPVPARATDWGEPVALSATESVAE